MYTSFMTYNPNLSVAFGTCARFYPGNENVHHSNVQTITSMFRDDLCWAETIQFMNENFKNKDKVNTYCLASSDGAEPYTFAITVKDRLPQKDYSKYLPVFASDSDEEVINAAKSGKINLSDLDLTRISKNTLTDKNYFEYSGNMIHIKDDICYGSPGFNAYKPIPELAESVKFEQSDALEKLKGIKDDGNSVILCRNVFKYMTTNYVDDVVKTASDNLKSGSLFIVGDEDEGSGVKYKLEKAGFEEKLPNVFRKV